jgi:hypothetical protein
LNVFSDVDGIMLNAGKRKRILSKQRSARKKDAALQVIIGKKMLLYG